MNFSHAACVLCGGMIYPADWLLAYRIKGSKPERVRLVNEQPWAGVRVICRNCHEFVATSDTEVIVPTEDRVT